MSGIGQAVFLSLSGDVPADLSLPPLATTDKTFETIRDAFTPFLLPDLAWTFCGDLAQLPPPAGSGTTLVYIMGHAWRRDGTYSCALKRGGGSVEIGADELLRHLDAYLSRECLLIVDTCHAAALAPLLEGPSHHRASVIFASAADQPAIELPLDSATRFALALREALSSLPGEVDTAHLAIEIRRRINSSALIRPQHVSYLAARPPIALTRADRLPIPPPGVHRTYWVVRAVLVGFGAVLTGSLVYFAWFFWGHIQVEIAAPRLAIVEGALSVSIRLQDPESNTNALLQTHTFLPGNLLRLRLPANNLLFVVQADYRDQQSRSIRFHLVRRRSFDWASKFVRFDIPSNSDIESHPNMAYIPVTGWIAGPEKAAARNEEAFWIDLYPATVERYLPMAERAVAEGVLQDYQSALVHERQKAAAVDAVGLRRLPKLAGDLARIFNVIEAPATATRRPDEVPVERMPSAQIPCPKCPAPMTLKEARHYCESQGKTLPTDRQWELAARGVDGRLYPWGNRFEKDRANIIGLPDKGQAFQLRPVVDYPKGESPYGVFDLVGNAGDWINSNGGYERTFIGGAYRFDPENALVYSLMPDTGEPLPSLEVTCRCVSASRP